MSIFTQERQRRAEAELEAQRRAAKQVRDQALRELEYVFADGSVIQTRPVDLPNFQTAIQLGGSHKWVMKNNTTRMTTQAELQEAMQAGIAAAKVIWDDYAASLDAINA